MSIGSRQENTLNGGFGLRVYRVHTECIEPTQVADRLAPFCGDDSVALPGARGLSAGAVTRFVVTLSSGLAVFSGRGQVLTVIGGAADGEGANVRLKVLEVDEETRPFWSSLLSRRRPAAARMPGPPSPPSGLVRPPPPLPVLEPAAQAFAGLAQRTSFGEDERLGQNEDPTVSVAGGLHGLTEDETLVPHLAAPARMAPTVRTTGKVPGYTGKVMVARKSSWPPWATAIALRLRAMAQRALLLFPDGVRHHVVRFGPWGGFWILGLLCGFCWKPAPAPRAVHTVTPVAAAVVASPQPLVAAAPLRPMHDHCSVNFTTQPPGATVYWGETSLGETPLVGATVPCGRTLVAFRLVGYEPLVVTMTATLDGPVVFSQALKRNEASLNLSTAPAAVQVSINGKPAGSTPSSFAVPEGEPFELELQKTGYVPLKRTIRVVGQKAMQLNLQPVRTLANRAKRRR